MTFPLPRSAPSDARGGEKLITFRVYGEPKAQPRPRAFAKKIGSTFTARVYDAGTAEEWKGLIALEVRGLLPPVPLEGPIRLDATFLFDRPKRLLRKRDPDERIPHVAKPDRDNLEKALLDCLTQLRLLVDDCQVCAGEVRKFYVARGERPGAEITIEVLGEATGGAHGS